MPIIEFFYEKYKDFNILSIDEMVLNLFLYQQEKGASVHLMIYVYLMDKYLKYDLGNIFISGSENFNFENKKIIEFLAILLG